jgi:hypothetical protein
MAGMFRIDSTRSLDSRSIAIALPCPGSGRRDAHPLAP